MIYLEKNFTIQDIGRWGMETGAYSRIQNIYEEDISKQVVNAI